MSDHPGTLMVLNTAEYVDDGGMTAERRQEIIEEDCENCGYDRAKATVEDENGRRDRVTRVECQACGEFTYPYRLRDE